MSQGENSVTSRNANQLMLDVRKLKKLSDYVDEKKEEIQKLTGDFTCMNYNLLWDSKVPDKDWSFFYCFSLTSSNRYDVLKEIEKYENFYEDLSNFIYKIENSEEQNDAERDTYGPIIDELQKKLLKMHKAAELGRKNTASSAIYRLHKSFIEGHEALRDMITGVESVALLKGYKEARVGWQKSLQRVIDLEKKFNDSKAENNDLSTRFENLMSLHESNMEVQNKILNENETLKENQKVLELKCQELNDSIAKNNEISTHFENLLMSIHESNMEVRNRLLSENETLKKNQKVLELKCQKMQEEIEKLQKKNQEM